MLATVPDHSALEPRLRTDEECGTLRREGILTMRIFRQEIEANQGIHNRGQTTFRSPCCLTDIVDRFRTAVQHVKDTIPDSRLQNKRWNISPGELQDALGGHLVITRTRHILLSDQKWGTAQLYPGVHCSRGRDTITTGMKIVLVAVLSFASMCFASAADQTHWIGTWGASPAPEWANPAQMLASKLLFANQTVREIVHTSAGGNTVRVRLSNAYGSDPITIGAAHIALRGNESAITAASDRVLTFNGRPSVLIPANALVLSDPVKLDVPASADLAISIFLPKPTAGAGIHYSAQQTSYIAAGDLTSSASLPEAAVTLTSWVFLTGVDVAAPVSAATIVAFGDSITDGARSTVDANRRWPNFLADRLLAQKNHSEFGVLDEGIGGNRVLHDPAVNVGFGVNALARFDRDVLSQPGVRYVIVMEGINDIGHPGESAPQNQTVSAEEIIGGLRQMAERAHENGIKIFGATLTPFTGTTIPGYFTPEKEVKRKAVNEWIRSSHAFDGVIDFDKAVQDPANPVHMLAAYDGGDHLHPGDAGYKAMGEAINLSLFTE